MSEHFGGLVLAIVTLVQLAEHSCTAAVADVFRAPWLLCLGLLHAEYSGRDSSIRSRNVSSPSPFVIR